MTSDEYIQVPLVVYVNGERKVVGEATIKGEEVMAQISPDSDAGRELIDYLSHPTSCFSMSWTPPEERRRNVFDDATLVPPEISDKLRMYDRRGILEELDPPIDLSSISFPPNQDRRLIDIDSFRDRPIKEPQWWEGLEMDPKEENT